MSSLTLRAPAKLNLYLHIEGRRADGYHLMESLVAFTELADELHIDAAENLSLHVTGEFANEAGTSDSNLVLQAARALQAHTGCSKGATIRLTKNIPVGAGLGGGSADAAAALRGLNGLWHLGVSDEALHRIALTLGADVPMCLAGVSSIARGIGDVLDPLPVELPTLYALLVHPRAALLTKDVYTACAQLPMPQVAPWQMPTGGSNASSFIASLAPTRNHLQPAAIGVSPFVAEVLLTLETSMPTPDLVRMTGSGACCFALYADEARARVAQAQMMREHPDWFSCLTRLGA